MPPVEVGTAEQEAPRVHAEDIAFDKAEDAASVEKLRLAIESVDQEFAAVAKAGTDQDRALLDELMARKQRLTAELERATELMKSQEQERQRAATNEPG
jgi:hypothetical protein